MILPVNDHQNPIIALLNGPDTRYKNILMNENIPIVNNPCQDKNSFLQIHVRPLNTKQQKRLLDKHQCLHFTFPVPYPCPRQSKKKQSSKFNSQLSNRLKSAVSILFNDDQVDNMSRYKIPKENHSSNGIVDHLLQLNNDI